MGKPWFRVKRYGFGAGLPCSWEGWVVLAVFLAITVGSGLLNQTHPLAHVAVILTATAAVVLVAWRKSDGPWKWRNGGD
uniref:Uncharacterized protein n=1 Tax=Caulobacter sp. (strain K31) TaxID=366602 RepID=B0T1P9_CAUSK